MPKPENEVDELLEFAEHLERKGDIPPISTNPNNEWMQVQKSKTKKKSTAEPSRKSVSPERIEHVPMESLQSRKSLVPKEFSKEFDFSDEDSEEFEQDPNAI